MTHTQNPPRSTEAAGPAPAHDSVALRAGRIVLQRYSLVLLWILMLGIFAVTLPGDISALDSMRAVLGQQTPLVFLGLAVVVTMSVGEFDLSFANIFGLSATLTPAMVVLHGWSFVTAAALTLVVAALFGLINAVLVVLVGINSVVVTLGVGSIAGGIAFWVSQETVVSGMDPALSNLTLSRFLGLPAIFWYGLVMVAIAAYIMSATPVGRHMLFVGSNREVARLAGIPVTSIRMASYIISALIVGICGVIMAAGLGGFDPNTAEFNFLPTFASVFLGTVAVVPGRFNPIGMLIAVYFLLTGVFGLQLLGYSGWVTNVFYGVALIAAVTASTLVQRRVRG